MRNMLFASAGALLAAPAAAQDINIDFGVNFGGPSSTHAAAGQAGEWNSLALPVNASLMDINGMATPATVTTMNSETEFSFDNTGTSGDDEAVLDDGFDPGGSGNSLIFNGLADGIYTVITYAWAPDSNTYETLVDVVGSQDPPQIVGGPWSGSYVLGDQYAEHVVDVVGGTLQIDFSVATSFATVNGVQLSGGAGLGTSYCTAAANSVSAAGSRMSASGSTSISAADVTLNADNAPTQPAIFFLGPNQVLIPFGNGFRCVGGTVTRLPVIAGSGGVFSYAIDFGTYGSVISGMGTVDFQCWYRDPTAGGSFYNLSDGLEIVFTP